MRALGLSVWTLLSSATASLGLTLDFPANAELRAEIVTPLSSHSLATGPWLADTGVPSRPAEGTVTRQAWRVEAAGLTPLQMLAPLRAQLTADGFDILYDCAGRACGGFDFRASLELMDPPDMFVDLLDYHYVSGLRASDGSAVSLVSSRTAQLGFVQVTVVSPPDAEGLATSTEAESLGEASPAALTLPSGDVATQLETVGRAILPDLVFETGSAQLGAGDFPSLVALADYLTANPTRVVALVGHTDSVGSLDANIALSRRRAGSVLERLVSEFSVPRSQLQAEGMGYLSPIATNLTEAGRDANRRVEVIMVSTE